MANLQNYNGRYCESEFEYAFLSFLEAEGFEAIPAKDGAEALELFSDKSPD